MTLKYHHDPTYLQKKIDLGMKPKEIANELRVSYKLVELYLHKFNIPFTSQKP
jgi:transposase